MTEINLLRKISLFSSLSDKELERLSDSSEKRKYPRGNIVLYEGDEGRFLYLILKGRVKVSLSDERGKEIILGTLSAGNYFGEMAVFDRMPRSANVVTTEDSEFLMISQQALNEQIQKYPELAMKLLAEMSKRLREADEKIGHLALLDVRGRVAKVLLRLAEGENVVKSKDSIAIPRIPLKEMAAMSGISRESVSRILSDFARRGYISLTDKRIIVYEKLPKDNQFD